MSETHRSATIFIREDIPLPENLAIESEAFLPGWRVVKNIDRFALARKIERAQWTFFCLTRELKATVMGRDRSATLRKAVKSILAQQEGQPFNSLEITEVVPKRYFGIPFLNVIAHSRHIKASS